jgi:hypothetical protein
LGGKDTVPACSSTVLYDLVSELVIIEKPELRYFFTFSPEFAKKVFVEDVGVSIENAFRLDRKGDRSNLAGQVGGNLSKIYPHIFILCALILPLFAILLFSQ